MEKLNWRVLRCDNSGPNCPEVATDGDMVYLRSTKRPDGVAVFDRDELAPLAQALTDGDI